jgi:ribosome-binding ATPase YchF (GTP1/OBG family)
MATPPLFLKGHRLTLLCLHGKTNSGSVMREKLGALRKRLPHSVFLTPDAPHVDPEGGLSWLDPLHPRSLPMLHPGDLLQPAPPCDVVIGFSQGCYAGHCLVAEGAVRPEGVVYAGAVLPSSLRGYEAARGASQLPVSTPALFLCGERDSVVPQSRSEELASLYVDPVVRGFPGAHTFPSKTEDLDAIVRFLEAHTALGEAHLEELGALWAIYEGDERVSGLGEAGNCIVVRLAAPNARAPGVWVDLAFAVGGTRYLDPDPARARLPIVFVNCDESNIVWDNARSLREFLTSKAEMEQPGTPMLFSLISSALEWLECEDGQVQQVVEVVKEEVGGGKEEEEEEESVGALGPDTTGLGEWNMVIGLVGKPSAGKSTFFNAARQGLAGEMAAMAPHPFTTIDPNFGQGFFLHPCPCAGEGEGQLCDAEFGHDAGGLRRVPLTIKDVAGLVPGAHKGFGKGNRFLNDLVDADVLLAIIDASGTTTTTGEEEGAGAADPVAEVSWVSREIEQWILCNVEARLDIIRRRPEKLRELFSGYHANQALIDHALQLAELDITDTAAAATWDTTHLERLVQIFRRLRFPILVIANKSDHPDASANTDRIRAAYPDASVVSLSAKAELATAGAPGVLAAITQAIALRCPTVVFPVDNLDTQVIAGIGKLPVAITLRPASTAFSLFQALKRRGLLKGEFVRAEGLDGKKAVILKKDDESLAERGVEIIKIMTTRKR